MNYCKYIGLIFCCFCYPIVVLTQNWPQVYYDNQSAYPFTLIEIMDKGYMYGGGFYEGEIPSVGFILKTDINGDVLWDKKIGEKNDITAVKDVQQTIDGGYIFIGASRKLDSWYDPFIMKLNACGEKEWCNIMHLPENMDFGTSIVQLPDEEYIALLRYFSYNSNERVWLVGFDTSGEMLWKKVYAQEDSLIRNEEGYDLLIGQDSSIIVTGKGSYPDPDTLIYRQRPMLIKTDFEGNQKWGTLWGTNEYFGGHGVMSVFDKQGNIYTAGRHVRIPLGLSPTLLKTSKSGQEILYIDINDTTQLGMATTISWLADSSLVLGAGWKFHGNDTIFKAAVKMDTLGNVIKTKILLYDANTFQGQVTTFDNKILLMGGFSGGGNFDIIAFKLNQDLEYDSIYTQPFVYDSLCPYPIVSDTIPLDCVIVGLEEKKQDEQANLKMVPNPAADMIRIVLPEYIVTQSQLYGVKSTTWRYNYSSESILQIFDFWGALVLEQNIAEGQKEIEINLTGLSSGIYVARVVLEGQVVSGKFVKK